MLDLTPDTPPEDLLAERDLMVELANGGAVARANVLTGMLIALGALDAQGQMVAKPTLVEPPGELAG